MIPVFWLFEPRQVRNPQVENCCIRQYESQIFSLFWELSFHLTVSFERRFLFWLSLIYLISFIVCTLLAISKKLLPISSYKFFYFDFYSKSFIIFTCKFWSSFSYVKVVLDRDRFHSFTCWYLVVLEVLFFPHWNHFGLSNVKFGQTILFWFIYLSF